MAGSVPLPRPGHALRLLPGSGSYFPALIAAIDAAERTVRLETYIFDFTGTGADVAHALQRAAGRGVRVQVVADGFGTGPVPPAWEERFLASGVEWRVFARLRWFGMLWPGNWSRLHRKLCVVDAKVAFCGGINILDDLYDPNHGKLEAPRFDFAVEVRGPLVAQVEDATRRMVLRMRALSDVRHARLAGALDSVRAFRASATASGPSPETQSHARAAIVFRDNLLHRGAIERAYRRAIGTAREEVIIANAYFVPGGKMRRALIATAQRGVKVRLLLQGRYEYFMQYYAARPVYGALLRAGVEIHEYSPSFLHAKVAVVDGHWATVGSSNLDPLSLLLAREANVIVEDAAFAARLREQLVQAMQAQGQPMNAGEFERRPLRQRLLEYVALALMRMALFVQGKKYL